MTLMARDESRGATDRERRISADRRSIALGVRPTYRLKVEPREEGGMTASVVEFPEVNVMGSTTRQVVEAARVRIAEILVVSPDVIRVELDVIK